MLPRIMCGIQWTQLGMEFVFSEGFILLHVSAILEHIP